MYLRTRTWAILSLICFLAAFYFWRLGEERSAREQEARRAAQTNAIIPLLSAQTNVAAQVKPRAVGFVETNGPVPYRVSNTRLPIDELIRSDAAVLLRNALIDVTADVDLPIPPHLRVQGETKSYVVQSRGTISESFRSSLKNAGAEIVSYVPNNAYLVRVSPENAQSLRGLPEVQAVIAWEPIFKITDSKLLALAVEQQPLPNGNPLVVMAFPGEEEATAQALRDLGGDGDAESVFAFWDATAGAHAAGQAGGGGAVGWCASHRAVLPTGSGERSRADARGRFDQHGHAG